MSTHSYRLHLCINKNSHTKRDNFYSVNSNKIYILWNLKFLHQDSFFTFHQIKKLQKNLQTTLSYSNSIQLFREKARKPHKKNATRTKHHEQNRLTPSKHWGDASSVTAPDRRARIISSGQGRNSIWSTFRPGKSNNRMRYTVYNTRLFLVLNKSKYRFRVALIPSDFNCEL